MARATRSGTRADAAILAVCVTVSLVTTILPATMRQSLAAAVRETVVGPLIRLQARVGQARGALVEQDVLAARIDSLVLRNAELADIGRENDRLRAMLGLGERLRTTFVPAEALVAGGGPEAQTIVVTAGSRDGVVVGSAIVAPEGLVGTVTEVSRTSAIALLWTHPDFRVSAMSADGAAFGIIAPHVADEPAGYLLELRGVAYRDSLPLGTEIRSSGLGSVFRRGIPIGVVIEELRTGEGWSRTYLVRPAVMPSDVSIVAVLVPGAGVQDTTAVWSSTPSQESLAPVPTGVPAGPSGRSVADSGRGTGVRSVPP